MLAQRRYWKFKRVIDAAAAFVLLVICSPIILFTAALVAASLGFPVVFWQQRPGLGGRPFRLHKLRTMNSAHTRDGSRRSDRERTTLIGSVLRRVRADELPQLFNILRGDMSFVGPRPLLPRDQSAAYRARLLVRPGLTGWAQVVGGRDISAEDKAALDVWYVRNASLALDIEIALRTVPVVLFGERISASLIERAWRDLSEFRRPQRRDNPQDKKSLVCCFHSCIDTVCFSIAASLLGLASAKRLVIWLYRSTASLVPLALWAIYSPDWAAPWKNFKIPSR